MKPVANQTAQILLDTIQAQPGLHFRGVLRRAGLSSAGQLRHHIDRLMRAGHIVEVEDGGFRRYFPAGVYDRRLREEMLQFSRPIPRRVARLLLRGSMPRTEIRRALQCPDSTLGYYLARLRDKGILEREALEPYQYYSLKDPQQVQRILEAQPEGAARGGEDLITAAPA